MSRIKVIHISDIHFDRNDAAEQGLVLNKFFEDLENTIDKNDKDNTFCLISGDLVNKGNSDKIFEEFYDSFICRILKYVELKNIYCTPGNHDFNRIIIENNFDEHNKIIEDNLDEILFNDFLDSDDNLILKKFDNYKTFCQKKLRLTNFNLLGFHENLIPEISFFFLNCSLLCSGGYKGLEDKGKLKIHTSKLNKWIVDNKGRTKVLVMHHPLNYLTSFAEKEIKEMLKNEIDILISGHMHSHELEFNYSSQNHGYINVVSPQLYSKKIDLNGYSILCFDGARLNSIEYRQWVKGQRKFMRGIEFSGTDDGIRTFQHNYYSTIDVFLSKLRNNFEKSMKSYSRIPCWSERHLRVESPNSTNRKNSIKFDYFDILNDNSNFQIIAAPQFGLTCYARYLALKAFEVKNEKWVYVDSFNWTFSKYHSDVDEAINDLGLNNNDISCFLLDNWRNALKDSQTILENIKRRFPQARLVIFSNLSDNIVLEGLDTEESHIGFKQLYLTELTKKGLRNIVKNFNDINQIAEENILLSRLDIDLIDLNIHRTPLNCLQLLIAFQTNFEDRPVNRSKVFSQVLKVVFENPGKLFYGDVLDEENCGFVLGYFCQELLKSPKKSFSENDFHNTCIPFCEREYNTTNTYDLLEVLKHNQILVSSNGELRFRFSYWISFFAAKRMIISADFCKYMLKDKHSLYFPEIIEFYTGIDGFREDVAEELIEHLTVLTSSVHSKIGLNQDFNPFKEIKWSLSERAAALTSKQLIENVQSSKISDELKDVISDENYDSVKPYTQEIGNFLQEYEVKNLMDLTRSAARGLRNSEFIKSSLKEQLIEKIFVGFQEIISALYLIAPMMAKNGYGGVGGARFHLTDDFPKEYNECLSTIIVNMPFNIKLWYKDDIFSDKIILLLRKYLINHSDHNIRHILALIECSTRPKGWKDSIMNYIETCGKNSFYLGNIHEVIISNYISTHMSKNDLSDCEYLIKATWAKHHKGTLKPGSSVVNKIPNDIIPERNQSDFSD